MKTACMTAVFLGLAASTSPAAAQSSPAAWWNPSGLPTAESDLKVPAKAKGKLAEFAGAPWWGPLSYCNAVWSLARNQTDDVAEKQLYLQKAVEFRMLGQDRFMTDRGVPAERATSAFTAASNGYAFAMRRTEDRAALLAKGDECKGVLAGYNAVKTPTSK